MILKIFSKKKENPGTSAYAEQTRLRLDILKSDLKLGKISESEYRELCKTINDGALKLAEEKLERLENENYYL